MITRTPAVLPHLVDLLLDAVFLVDAEGRIVYASAACETIFGYTPEEMTGKTMMDFVAPVDRQKTRQEAENVMAGRERVGFENRYIRKDGRLVHLMWSARWYETEQLRIGVARDITERKRAEDMQAATYAISEAAQSAGDIATMLRGIHGILANLVPAAGFAVALENGADASVSLPYHAGLSADPRSGDALVLQQLLHDVRRSGDPVLRAAEREATDRAEEWIALPVALPSRDAGAMILKSERGTRFSDKDRELLQYAAIQVATALERRRLHDELTHAARYDELTGLPNRRMFHDRVASALARTRRHDERFALLYVDIDDFKQINDSLGHPVGDSLLQETARRLKQCVREEDTVARLGGDEFVVLLEELQEPEDALLVAEKVAEAVCQPVHVDGHLLCVQSSIGIALYPDHGESAEQLLRHADMKMYQVKKAKTAGV